MVLTKLAGPSAIAFAAFITSDKGRAILAKYGFSLPDRP
jgi:ABC-type molybdate transport system substrate-binding protein